MFLDMPVLAQFSVDSEWYRAQVRSMIVSDSNPAKARAEVTYMDYGNAEILPVSR